MLEQIAVREEKINKMTGDIGNLQRDKVSHNVSIFQPIKVFLKGMNIREKFTNSSNLKLQKGLRRQTPHDFFCK